MSVCAPTLANTDESTKYVTSSDAMRPTLGSSTTGSPNTPLAATTEAVILDVGLSLTNLAAANSERRRFRRGLEWDWLSPKGFLSALDSSLRALPLPRPPDIGNDPCAAYALRQYPEMFKVICPVDVPALSYLLRDHPNQPFVASVMMGLTHGFWPFAALLSSETVEYPNHGVCSKHPDALSASRDEEVAAGRYSPPFHHLLPGMKVSPLLVVAKPGSSKLWVCTDMSFGSPSLNDLVDKDLAHVSYDSLASFGPYLFNVEPGKGHRVLWKSDVARAYRNLPMAPQWQVRQIVRVQNAYHADRCSNFGSAASPKIWCAVFSLVLWVAINRLGVRRINNLMDDTWGVAHSSSLVVYKGSQMPLDQALLLLLFDTINLPWEWKKQLHGRQLEIIGHHIDTTSLLFSLAPEKKSALGAALRAFTSAPSHRLREWQRLLGWASWGLNAFPYGRFALQAAWEKLSDKSAKFAPIHVNREIQEDLRWLASSIEVSPGELFLEASIWPIRQADLILVTDACPTGLGVWLPNSREGFHHQMPAPPPATSIGWSFARSAWRSTWRSALGHGRSSCAQTR